MLKGAIRLLSALTAFFFAFLSLLLMKYDNESFPLGTTENFTLAVGGSQKPDAVLAAELHEFASKHGIYLYQHAHSEGSLNEGGQDLVAFGLATEHVGEKITWFNKETTGSIIAWDPQARMPLSGYYNASGGEEQQQLLNQWAEESAVQLQWQESRKLKSFIVAFTLNNGVGFAALSVLVTLTASVIVWYVTQAKSAALRLLSGVKRTRVITQDLRRIYSLIFLPLLLTWLISLAVVVWRYGGYWLPIYARWSGLILCAACGALALAILGIACIARPCVDLLAKRSVPPSFVHMGWVVRAFGVLVAVIVVPYSVQYASYATSAQKSLEAWGKAREAVTLTMSVLLEEGGAREEFQSNFSAFIDDAARKNASATSFLWELEELPAQALGSYDGVALVDSHFLGVMGVEQPEKNKDFREVELASLSPELRREYFDPTTGLFIQYARQGHKEDFRLYEYRGAATVPVARGVLSDASFSNLKGKLLIYVKDACQTFGMGLLESSIINGHTLFRDIDSAQELITQHNLNPYVSSIRSASDQVTVSAHEYRNQALFGVSAGVLSLIAIFIAMIQAACIWAARNRRRIFVAHSSGESLCKITHKPLVVECIFMILVGVAALVFSVVATGSEAASTAVMVAGIVLSMICAAFCVYYGVARLEFKRVIKRRD